MNKAIVLSNGQFPRRREALEAILQIPLLVCCDGAYDKLVKSALFDGAAHTPTIFVVGDGDSLALRRVVLPNTTFVEGYTDQESNDLTKAVRYAISIGVERLLILGATGLREDHTLGNISLLAMFAAMRTQSGKLLSVRMYTDYGFFTPIRSSQVMPSFARQQVSLFSLDQGLTVSTEGLKYPIVNRQFRYWWEATLNEATGDSFSITIDGEGALLVYQTFDAK